MTQTLPKLPQYPLKPETIQGFTPTVADLVAQELITLSTSPFNMLILSVWKPNWQGWRLV